MGQELLVWLHDAGGGRLPARAHHDDAGLDLYVSEDTEAPAGCFTDLPCGLSIKLPEDGWGLILGRSSSLRTRGLMVTPSVIDAGYTGPIFVGVWNLTPRVVRLPAGDRVGQLILMDNLTARTTVRPVSRMPQASRGDRGFGSTGT